MLRWGTGAIALLVAALVAWSRVHLGYHTSEQVLVGFAIGSTVGMLYYFAVERACCPFNTSQRPFSLSGAGAEAKSSFFALLSNSTLGQMVGLEY